METFWFAAIAMMLSVYVVLDGFDLGAGVAHFVVSRDASERTRVLKAIGPFWDGVFAVSSALLAVFLGAALGNVVRGVPLSPEGTFFEPLFTDFRITGATGIVDWFTLLVGLFALAALSMHGGLWLVHKTTGELKERSRAFARRGLLATAALGVVVCLASWRVQPQLQQQLAARPAAHLLTLLAAAGLVGAWRFSRRGSPESWDAWAFLSSCLFLTSLLGVTAFGLHPFVLPSNGEPALGLTVHNAAAPAEALATALYWWVPGVGLAAGYTAFVYRRFRGRIDVNTAANHV